MVHRILQIAFAFIGLVLVWQAVILIGQYNESLLPSPRKVGESIVQLLLDGTLFNHLQVSMFRFSAGYVSAVLVAVLLGLILGTLPKLWAYLDPIAQVLRPVSPIAWSPFIVLWFGIGHAPAIVIIFIAAFFPVLLSTIAAVKKVDQHYLKLAHNFELKQKEILFKIIFPACFPAIIHSFRVALGAAWIFLVAGEMIGAQSGLGFLIVDGRNALRLDLVLAGIIIIGVCGLMLDKLISLLEKTIKV